jgi:hypothetical protein
MKRKTVVRLKNDKRLYDKNGKKVDSRRPSDEVDGAEYTMHNAHESRFWQVRLDEIDAFGPVTIYDTEGRITRVIERDALRRPWQEKVGNTWNNCIFPKRNSEKRDKV